MLKNAYERFTHIKNLLVLEFVIFHPDKEEFFKRREQLFCLNEDEFLELEDILSETLNFSDIENLLIDKIYTDQYNEVLEKAKCEFKNEEYKRPYEKTINNLLGYLDLHSKYNFDYEKGDKFEWSDDHVIHKYL